MRTFGASILVYIIIFSTPLNAQEFQYSTSIFGTYTTSSKLFHHPNNSDPTLRNEFLPLDNLLGIGIDIRRSLNELHLQIGLSAEYISKIRHSQIKYFSSQNLQFITIPVSNGFVAFPIELTAYFIIPIRMDAFHFYIGGGTGFYIGSRATNFADIDAKVIKIKPSVGIHILCGLEYLLTSRFSLWSELKFRDANFETTNKFVDDNTFYQGTKVQLEKDPLQSRLNIDGMTLTIGTALHF